MTMKFQLDNGGTMMFQFDNPGDVFATVQALRVAADRWVDTADAMKEVGNGFQTTEVWFRERVAMARRIADQIEAAAKAAGVTDTTRRPYNITWTEGP